MRTLSLSFLLASACSASPEPSGPTGPRVCAAVSEASATWAGNRLTLTDSLCGQVDLEARVLADGSVSVRFDRVDGAWQPVLSSETGAVVDGLVLEGAWSVTGEGEPVFWRQGFQSWSWSGVTALVEPNLDADGVAVPGGDGDGFSSLEDHAATSWWVGLLGRDQGSSLLLGELGATRTRFFVGVDGDQVQAVWGHRGDTLRIEPGGSVALDPLFVALGSDPNALHEAYADAVAARVPPRLPAAPPPVGWATWYQYYSEVDEDDVRLNLDALAALAEEDALAAPEVFQIDDGWQERWGDWRAGEDFPSGMAALAAEIQDAGFVPGLWLAPLYVSRDSETHAAHPDWWVRDLDGTELSFTNLGTDDYAVLDVTHPDAAAWLEDTLSALADQGWAYLKYDFLYAGAQVGLRQQDVTGIEAYHQAMTILRRASGDAWILACGAPLLPSVGYAESFRTGADIAFESDPDPTVAFYRWQARATAARRFTHGRWWWMDPDQLIIRAPFSEVEVRGALASGVAAGGTWMLGDDLTALPEDRRRALLDPDLLATLGQVGRPERPLAAVSGLDAGPVVEQAFANDAAPTTWTLEDGTVVLLNLGEAPVAVQGPGGTNLLTGETAEPGLRDLLPGDGEVWVP